MLKKENIKIIALGTAAVAGMMLPVGAGAFMGYYAPVIVGSVIFGGKAVYDEFKKEETLGKDYHLPQNSPELAAFNAGLKMRLEDNAAKNQYEPTPTDTARQQKDVLAILSFHLKEYVSGLPKNRDEWTPVQKEVYEYGVGLIKVYAKQTKQLESYYLVGRQITNQKPNAGHLLALNRTHIK